MESQELPVGHSLKLNPDTRKQEWVHFHLARSVHVEVSSNFFYLSAKLCVAETKTNDIVYYMYIGNVPLILNPVTYSSKYVNN